MEGVSFAFFQPAAEQFEEGGRVEELQRGVHAAGFFDHPVVPLGTLQYAPEPVERQLAPVYLFDEHAGGFAGVVGHEVPYGPEDGHAAVERGGRALLRHDAVGAETRVGVERAPLHSGTVAVNDESRECEPPAAVVAGAVALPGVDVARGGLVAVLLLGRARHHVAGPVVGRGEIVEGRGRMAQVVEHVGHAFAQDGTDTPHHGQASAFGGVP